MIRVSSLNTCVIKINYYNQELQFRKKKAIKRSNKGWDTLTLNYCMTDDLIEAIWIWAFFRYLETSIVSAGNTETCVYPAINHYTSKSLKALLLKLAKISWFPEQKSSETFGIKNATHFRTKDSELSSVLQLCTCKMGASLSVNERIFICVH